MELIKFNRKPKALPVKVLLSVESIVKELEGYLKDAQHPLHKSAAEVLKLVEQYPKLRTGLETFDDLDRYREILSFLFKGLFPDLLQTNEIKAICLPFIYKAFNPTKRFQTILENAGADYELKIRGFNIDQTYIYACTYILQQYYKCQVLKFNRPTYLDIPNQQTGRLHHYRLMFNADNMEIIKTKEAPDLTEADIDELLANGNDLELWKRKFPPGSYILKGFGVMNLFDTTADVLISQTRGLFLRKDDQVFNDFQQ
ncbi:MAG: GAF domain-containing protein, partial [Bacteroidota bacterium]